MNEKQITERDAQTPCLRCGTDAGPDVPRPSSCPACPPMVCGACGEPDDRSCSCWIDLSTLSLADVKSLFAASNLSLDHARHDDEGAI